MVGYWVAAGAVIGSAVALGLAVAGLLHPLTFLVAVPLTVVVARRGTRPFAEEARRAAGGGGLVVAVGIGVVVASMLSAGWFSGEHLLTNRDPGVYLSTSRWVADEGTLVVDGATGGFARAPGVTAAGLGFYELGDGSRLSPQFLHLLPVWGAVAAWVGGNAALLRINAVMIGLALLMFWLFASTFLRPWWAVVALAGVAVSLVTVHFARDLYSEPLAMVGIFGGLWMLMVARRLLRPWPSFLAGALFGVATMARIDGWLVVIGLLMVLFATWWEADRQGAGPVIRHVQHALLGLAVAGGIGLADAALRSLPYVAGRKMVVAPMFVVVIGVGLGGIGALRLGDRLAGSVSAVRRRATVVGAAVALLVVVGAIGLGLVRPAVSESHASVVNPVVVQVQQAEGIPIDGTRTYAELTMIWLSWYLGVGGLALAVGGAAWFLWEHVRGRRGGPGWAFLLAFGFVTVVYLWRPSISPDHLWAMRRFLPITLPGATLLATAAVARCWDRVVGRWKEVVAIVGVGLIVAVPLVFTWPLARSTSYRGLLEATDRVCEAVGGDGAVLMASRSLSEQYQAPVRAFCRIPVAGIDPKAGTLGRCELESLRRAWQTRGRRLFTVSSAAAETGGGVTRIPVTTGFPELRLTGRPRRMIAFTFTLSVREVTAATDCG